MYKIIRRVIVFAVILSFAAGATSSAGTNRTTLIIDRLYEETEEDRRTGYILVGESHISKSEQAVWNNSGVQETAGAGNLVLGQDLFFVHTLYLFPFQAPLHYTTQCDDINPKPEADILFAGACPDWLVKDGCAFPAGSHAAGQSAVNRIRRIQQDNGGISDWVVVIVQGYSVAPDEAKYGEYVNKIEDFARQLSGNTTAYMVGCPETYIEGTCDYIRKYNDYLKRNLQAVRFYDWNSEFNEGSYDHSEPVPNHLTLDSYYRLWMNHLGNELN